LRIISVRWAQGRGVGRGISVVKRVVLSQDMASNIL
jgi:hypothetical protein